LYLAFFYAKSEVIYEIFRYICWYRGFRLGMEQARHRCIGFCEIDEFARRSYKGIHDTRGKCKCSCGQLCEVSYGVIIASIFKIGWKIFI